MSQMKKVKHFLVIGGMTALFACQATNRKRALYSEVRTDLGPQGNQIVADEFTAYKLKAGGCITPDGASATQKRVLLTGFGPFQNNAFNISGVVAGTMADVSLWSGKIQMGASVANSSTAVSTGKITAADKGGRSVVRTISVDERTYLVCFLLLDVKWDLAAAIISYEAQRFTPKMVVMMGQGGSNAALEGGALNRATQYNGFDSAGGDLDNANIPTSDDAAILLNHPDVAGQPHERAMTWSNNKLRDAVAIKVHTMGYEIGAEPAARPSNDYICNNVSYVVLSGLAGESLSLAGGKVLLDPTANAEAKAGFLHLPNGASNQRAEIINWATVVATMVDTQLKD